MTGAVAIGLLAASAAFACTVAVHGGLVMVPGVAQAGDSIELFATLNRDPGRPPVETDANGDQEEYPVVMDPDRTSASVPPSGTPSECFGQDEHEYHSMPTKMTGDNDTDDYNDDGDLNDPKDDPGGDDVVVGAIRYGSEEAFGQASTSDPLSNPTDKEGVLYGHGSATIPNWSPGTYELCAQPEYESNWDHFRIISP